MSENQMQNTNLIDCPVCGKQISKTAPCCPNCGEKITLGKCRNKEVGMASLFALVIFFILSVIGGAIQDKTGNNALLVFAIIGIIASAVSSAICLTTPSR